jgi:RNA polymerase sigma factor (sigma-70 family)
MDELQLIQGLKDNDDIAIKALYATYTKSLCYFSAQMIGNREEASEIVSNSLCDFIDKYKKGKIELTSRTKLRTILFTIVRNQSIDAYRIRKRQQTVIQEYYRANSEEQDIERIERKAFILEKLYAEIDKLPAERRQIIRMHFFEGLSLNQIAEQKGISYNTVKNQKHEALKTIRLSFKKEEWRTIVLLLCLGAHSLN